MKAKNKTGKEVVLTIADGRLNDVDAVLASCIILASIRNKTGASTKECLKNVTVQCVSCWWREVSKRRAAAAKAQAAD